MFSKKEVNEKVVIEGIRYLSDYDERAMSGKVVGTVISVKSTVINVDTGCGIRSYYRKTGLAYSRGDYSKITQHDPIEVSEENKLLLKKAKTERIEKITKGLSSQHIIILDKILRDMQ